MPLPECWIGLPQIFFAISKNAAKFGKGVADEACMISGLEHEDPLGGGLALQKHFVTIRKAEETN